MIARGFKVICSVLLLVLLTVPMEGCGMVAGEKYLYSHKGEVLERPDTPEEAKARQAETEAGAGGAVRQYAEPPTGTPVEIWRAGNVGGILDKHAPATPPTVIHDRVYYVTEVYSYHWNGSKGAPAGEVSMRGADGTTYGPWKTELFNKVYWLARPNIEMPAGTYTLLDSAPETWAQNAESKGQGMGWAVGIPAE
jgi:hypothetical protein